MCVLSWEMVLTWLFNEWLRDFLIAYLYHWKLTFQIFSEFNSGL